MSTTMTTPETLASAPSLCAVFQDVLGRRPDELALRSSEEQLGLTWREYGERVRRVASGLAALGVRPGDTVALMMTNRPEFFVVDLAVMHLGAIPFSIYNTSSPEQIRYLFATADTSVVVCEEQFLDRIGPVCAESGIDRVVCVDGAPAGTMSLSELEANLGEAGVENLGAVECRASDESIELVAQRVCFMLQCASLLRS